MCLTLAAVCSMRKLSCQGELEYIEVIDDNWDRNELTNRSALCTWTKSPISNAT